MSQPASPASPSALEFPDPPRLVRQVGEVRDPLMSDEDVPPRPRTPALKRAASVSAADGPPAKVSCPLPGVPWRVIESKHCGPARMYKGFLHTTEGGPCWACHFAAHGFPQSS